MSSALMDNLPEALKTVGPPAVMQALDRGETVDPTSYYFRLSGSRRPAPRNTTGEPDHRHRYRQSCSRWTDLQHLRSVMIPAAVHAGDNN